MVITDRAGKVLVEVDDFLGATGPRVRRLAEDDDSPIGQVWVIGSYAVPLTADELAADVGPESSA